MRSLWLVLVALVIAACGGAAPPDGGPTVGDGATPVAGGPVGTCEVQFLQMTLAAQGNGPGARNREPRVFQVCTVAGFVTANQKFFVERRNEAPRPYFDITDQAAFFAEVCKDPRFTETAVCKEALGQ